MNKYLNADERCDVLEKEMKILRTELTELKQLIGSWNKTLQRQVDR